MSPRPGVRHVLLLGLPTGIWQRQQPGEPPSAGDHVVVHPGLRAVVVGTTVRPDPLPDAAFLRVTGPAGAPGAAGRWEELLARLGWRPLIPDPEPRRSPGGRQEGASCPTPVASPRP